MTPAEIRRAAARIAGAAWDDRDAIGTLAEQLRRVAESPRMGTAGDLTEQDRTNLRRLAEQAEAL